MSSQDEAERVRRASEAYNETHRQLGEKALEATTARAEQIRQYGVELGRARDAAVARLDAQGPFPGVEMVDVREVVETGFLIKRAQAKYTKMPGWQLLNGDYNPDPHLRTSGYHSTRCYLLADGSFYGYISYESGETLYGSVNRKMDAAEVAEEFRDVTPNVIANLDRLGTTPPES